MAPPPQAAYRRAGRPDQALRTLEQLTHNAIVENRFKDGSYFYRKLADIMLDPCALLQA